MPGLLWILVAAIIVLLLVGVLQGDPSLESGQLPTSRYERGPRGRPLPVRRHLSWYPLAACVAILLGAWIGLGP